MKTIGEILKLSTHYLAEKKIASARLQAEEILADTLGCKRLDLYLQFERPLDEKELSIFREQLKRRAKGEPLGYLLSKFHFFHCDLTLSRDALIPRQESEILISKVVSILKEKELKGKSALDLCTGSGCLGISLKKQCPDLEVFLSDLSPAALALARRNALQNNVDVAFLEGDLLDPFVGKRADILLCNPPYISQEEYEGLDHEVRDFEPKEALLAGKTGLEFYARLAQQLPRFLNPSAKVFFEIGSLQGSRVQDLFHAPCWKEKRVEKDWAGHDRFFFLEFE
ncbi:MAG: peptide chain release factor N(5)-glutamine methyltransferase [Chlamydiales bacterium]